MAIRDTFISVLFGLEGADELEELDDQIDETAENAEDMGDSAETAGEDMERAGERGQESFTGVAGAVELVVENIATVASTSTAFFGGLSAATAFSLTQAGQIQSATAQVEALAGDQGQRLIASAERTEQATDNLVSARQALQGQFQLLGQAGLSPDVVDQVTESIAILSATMEGDAMQAFDRFADPLNEATGGFEEIINSGPLTAETFLNQAQMLGLNVETLNDFNEEMDKQVARQALINTIQLEANNRKDAAVEIQSSWNSIMTRGNNILEETASALFADLLPPLRESINEWLRWFDALQESNPEFLASIGRLLVLANAVAGITTVVSVAVLAWTFLGGAILTTIGWTLAIIAAITLAIVVLTDLISGLITGQELFVDWSEALNALDDLTINLLQSTSEWKVGLGLLLASIVGVGRGIEFLINKTGELLSWFGKISGEAFQIGKEFIGNLIEGVQSESGALFDEMSDIAGRIRDYWPFSPAETGPLSDLDQAGRGFIQTVSEGVVREQDTLVRSTSETVERTREVMTGSDTEPRTARRVPADDPGGPSGLPGRRLRLEIVDASGIPESTEKIRRLAEEITPILDERFSVSIEGAGRGG